MFKYLSLYHDQAQAQAGQKLWDRETLQPGPRHPIIWILFVGSLVPRLPGDTFISIGQGKYWENYIGINKLWAPAASSYCFITCLYCLYNTTTGCLYSAGAGIQGVRHRTRLVSYEDNCPGPPRQHQHNINGYAAAVALTYIQSGENWTDITHAHLQTTCT